MNLPLLNPFDLDFPEVSILQPNFTKWWQVIDDCLEDGYIVTAAFNEPVGTLLAAGCSDGRVLIYDFATHGLIKSLWGHIRQVSSVSWRDK